ncbi:hypothetical protein H0H81_003865 [Sphagnurus paluster]|uniref:Response regulatory domain-containing protein n=1 Tax=Sphagnurus paluster TaxID=117069 RepID=A0A9P7FUS1_9AGAR|nr:hypothetical protein H0H81_003865 [Sphagnurus paluster]
MDYSRQHQQQQFPPSPSQLHSRGSGPLALRTDTLPALHNLGRYEVNPHHTQQQQLWSPHRAANPRDELHDQQQHQQHQQQQHQQQKVLPNIKRESTGQPSMPSNDTNAQASSSRASMDDSMPATSDFVKKLFKMLEDQSFQQVVSWGPQGDCFVVKDMNEFTKSILPRMFKHSNFASFVRQLNKYDFHKVKNTDDVVQYGEQSWTFRHPDFHADRRDALENIKRKVPAQRKQQQTTLPSASAPGGPHHRARHSHRHRSRSPSYSHSHSYSRSPSPTSQQVQLHHQIQELHAQVGVLQAALRTREARERELEERVRRLERGHGGIAQGLVDMQRGIAIQDGMVRNLVGDWVGIDNPSGVNQNPQGTEVTPPQSQTQNLDLDLDLAVSSDASANPAPSDPMQSVYAPFLDAADGSNGSGERNMGLGGRPEDVARASLLQMSEYSRRQLAGQSQSQTPVPGQLQQEQGQRDAREQEPKQAQAQEIVLTSPPQNEWMQMQLGMGAGGMGMGGMSTSMGGEEHEGLQVYTVGHLMPRSAQGGPSGWNGGFDSTQQAQAQPRSWSASSSQQQPASGAEKTIRVRRSTFVPGWAVPPRVLLVDDDAVNLRKSSKFLQVFGCTIDVAVDGVGAVNKMNLEKYDLVLMDIVMPKLDGISATSLIRKFDHMTPIISMTSNSKPNEIMTYYSSGMNDILPKPFTKEGLLDMLEKHLIHLKVIQQRMQSTSVPRALTPSSSTSFDASFPSASTSTATMTSSSSSSPSNILTQSPLELGTGFGFGFDVEDDGRINPLAGMGLTDEQYTLILQNIVSGEGLMTGDVSGREKRGRDEIEEIETGREKRSRFEVIE